MEANQKIARSKTKLLIKHPFFGSLALSLHFVQQPDGQTMATDGTKILWSEDFVNRCTEDEVTGVIAHEVMHVAMKHMLRRGERNHERWNIAADYVINDILIDAGFTLPENGLFDDQYKGMTAEKVYEQLPEDQTGEPEWGQVMDAKGKDGKDPSPAEAKQMEAEIDQRVFMAANAAKAAGKLPAAIEGMVNKMRRSKVDWRDVFHRFVGGDQPDDYTFRRCNRKVYYTQGIYMPAIDKIGVGDVVVAVDTSGSVNQFELEQFVGELNAITEEHKPRSVTVITCDSRVQDVKHYCEGEVIDKISAKGRGGTRVQPVFDYIEDQGLPVDNMVYLTDMGIWDYPDDAPDYPVLWVSTYPDCDDAPFGQTTRIEVEA